jgi:hypothetical protein
MYNTQDFTDNDNLINTIDKLIKIPGNSILKYFYFKKLNFYSKFFNN